MRLFPYYGSKVKNAKKYSPPKYGCIVEPFAGAAGYSCLYHDRRIVLCEKNPVIFGVIKYLIGATRNDILNLPLLSPNDSVDDFDISDDEKNLIGFWLNSGCTSPAKRLSSWGRSLYPELPVNFWGKKCRERLSQDVEKIKHWEVVCADYRDLTAPSDEEITWFVDPPYIGAGSHYKEPSKNIDYGLLADWCRSRVGQVIVCENDGADWLDFRPMYSITGQGRGRNKRVEVVWENEK